MQDCFEILNFLTKNDYDAIGRLSTKIESFIDPNGVFKGTESSRQQWFDNDTELGQILVSKLKNVEKLCDNIIDGMQVVYMFKPYDVHGDYLVQKNQVPISDPKVAKPTYTVCIPLVDGDYHTVVFDQSANYNNFSDYKKTHEELTNHVDDETWKKYCGHCHAEDQRYLTIKKVIDWHKGGLFAWDRTLFHASGNYTRPRKAIVLWLSKSN